MKPASFKYVAPRSLDEALALKAEHGAEARFLAGGQSLVPAMNFRAAQPAVLIDIKRIGGLGDIMSGEAGTLRIGALVRHAMLERDALTADRQPLLRETVRQVAHPQIRNRGTLGGNLSHAEPASELPAVMVALGARMRVQSTGGERWIAAPDFFVGALTTALGDDEMLVEVETPALLPRTGTAFVEMARRRGDFAIMGVAATVTLDETGNCAAARLVYCNAAETPLDAAAAAQSLVGHRIDKVLIGEAAALARAAVRPFGSVHASEDFQRHLAEVLTCRALATALARAA